MSNYSAVNYSTDGDIELKDKKSSSAASMSKDHGSDMQRVILCYFGVLGFICLLVLYGSLLGIVLGTNASLQTSIEEDLNAQMRLQAFSTISEAGDYVTRVLNGYTQSVVEVTSLSTANVLRDDMLSPIGAQPQIYWDLDEGVAGLPLPVTSTDPRFLGQEISLTASNTYVMEPDAGSPEYTVANIATWYGCLDASCLDFQKKLGKTCYLDESMKYLWDKNEELIQMYIGFNTNPPSLRRYPARPAHSPTGEITGYGNQYNPTIRPWYEAAIDAKPETIYTTPYKDAHGLGWMITGAKAVYDYERPIDYSTATPIGVMGIDILITDIADVLNNIKFLESGKLTLFTGTSGQVVTDPEWDISAGTGSEFYYGDLTKPAVSASTWDLISSTPAGETKEITVYKDGDEGNDDSSNKSLIYVKHLSDYNAQYYLAVFVDEEEILKPVNPAIEEMKSSNAIVSGALVGSLFGSMIILVSLMYLLIHGIVKVFNKMQENVEALLRNVGTGRGLGSGMVEVNENASNELQSLENSMNTMVHNLQKARSVQFIDVREGEGGAKKSKDQLGELWNMVPMASSLNDAAPPIADAYVFNATAPPPAYDA